MVAPSTPPRAPMQAYRASPRVFISSAPRCAKCDKPVYAAEQVIGPASREYHRFCLTCADCKKTLEATHLADHDSEPYCKNCYSKKFAIKGYGFAGAVQGEYVDKRLSNPIITRRPLPPIPGTLSSPLKETPRQWTPPVTSNNDSDDSDDDINDTTREQDSRSYSPSLSSTTTTTNNTQYSSRSIPPTISSASSVASSSYSYSSFKTSPSKNQQQQPIPSIPSYKNPLVDREICSRCNKVVYFAERIIAVSKVWHKGCLRCSKCSTSLNASRLSEKDGAPYCNKCYSIEDGKLSQGYVL